MTATTTPLPDLALQPWSGDDLHHLLADLRTQGRVVPVAFLGRDAWLVTGYDDIRAVLRDDDRFPGERSYVVNAEPSVGRTFISMPGRDHDLHRRLATPAFRSRAVNQFDTDELAPLVHAVVDEFAADGEADLVAAFARVVPIRAICAKLGLEYDGADAATYERSMQLLSYPVDPDGARAAGDAFGAVIRPALAAARLTAGADVDTVADGVLRTLAASQVDGMALSDDEIVSTVRLLFAVGQTTTIHAMANLLDLLVDRPELCAAARDDMTLQAGIVHELLRFEGPLGVLPRMTTEPVSFTGVDLPADAMLLLSLAGANRDPEQFGDDAGRFDPTREPGDVLTFGYGAKFCPGSHLARRELATMLAALLERLPNLRRVGPRFAPVGAVLRTTPTVRAGWDRV